MTTSISVTKMSLPPTNAAVVMETHEVSNVIFQLVFDSM